MPTSREIAIAFRNRAITAPIFATEEWTDWGYCQQAENVPNVGTDWVGAANLTAAAGNATCTLASAGTSDLARASGFPHLDAIQAEADIREIQFRLAALVRTNGSSSRLGSVHALKAGTALDDQPDVTPASPLAADATLENGLWGAEWTAADLQDDDFGLEFAHELPTGGPSTVSLASVEARVLFARRRIVAANAHITTSERLPDGAHGTTLQIIPQPNATYAGAGLMQGTIRMVVHTRVNRDRIGDASEALTDAEHGVMAIRDALAAHMHLSYLDGTLTEGLIIQATFDPQGDPHSSQAGEQWVRAAATFSYGFEPGLPHQALLEDGSIDRGEGA